MLRNRLAYILAAVLALASGAVLAETRTAGNFEIISDIMNAGGSAGAYAGDYALHQAVGQNLSHGASAAGNYELIGGFLGAVDETPPALEFTSPTATTTVSGPVGFIASAHDENGLRWSLYYGPTAEPYRYTGIDSGTGNFPASSIGTWDTSRYAGVYTAALVGTDDRGNTATASVSFSVVNMVTVSGTIPMQQWVLVSTPIQPDPADPISMYRTDGRDFQYKVYRWNPEKEYVTDFGRYEYPPALDAGDAYWVKVYYEDMPYSYSGRLATTTQDFAQAVKTGWNQIGAPFNRDFPWGEVRVRCNESLIDAATGIEVCRSGDAFNLETAAGRGLVSDKITAFDIASNSMLQYDATVSMEARKGYNMRAYYNVDLLFSPDAEAAPARPLAKVIRSPFDYRVKISAKAPATADLDNYFGAAFDGQPEYDRNDFEESIAAPGSAYTSLFFDNLGWRRNAGRYANDVRGSSGGGAEDWDFSVETTETGKTVTLTWDNTGLPADLYTFTLVCLDTGERIDMAARNSFSYTAAGSGVAETRFIIEVRRLDAEEVTKNIVLSPGWNLVSMPLDPKITAALAQLGDDLPLLNLYQFFDGKFYPAAEADIQAGIGYWIYVSDGARIDIRGMPSAPVIRIPLKAGWNIIGNPYDDPLPWDDPVISVEKGKDSFTLSAAVAAGLLDGNIYMFDGENYVRQEPGASIQAWKGYFINAPGECVLVMKR